MHVLQLGPDGRDAVMMLALRIPLRFQQEVGVSSRRRLWWLQVEFTILDSELDYFVIKDSDRL